MPLLPFSGAPTPAQRYLRDGLRRAADIASISNVIDNPVLDPSVAPVVTSAATDSQTVSYYMGNGTVLTNQDKVAVVGGVPFANQSGNYLAVKSVSSISGSNIGPSGTYQNGWYPEVMTDADVLSFSYYRTAESGVMVAVADSGTTMQDLQYVSLTPTTIYGSAGGSNNGSVTLTFPNSKPRRVRIECGSQQVDEQYGGGPVLSIRRFAVNPSYSIWKPYDIDNFNMAVIGDSYTAGPPRDTGMQCQNWARVMAAKLGCKAVQMALGGTGYSKALLPLPAASDPVRLADLSAQKYDIYVFALGTNDVSGNDGTALPLPDIQAKALICFQAARAANPLAPIVVVGPWPRPTFPLSTQQGCATAVEAAFAQFNDPNSLYIPIYDAVSGNWMAGTSYQGHEVNPNDISGRYIWTDGIHPIFSGHYYYGARVANIIRQWLADYSRY